jgi:plasmid maintenance system killer protein
MPLQLAFANKALRQLCESEARAMRQFGPEVAAKLKGRLADLRAASHVRELVAGRPRELPGELFAVELCDGYCIVLSSNHNVTPARRDGSVKWDEVRRVQLLRIERRHD